MTKFNYLIWKFISKCFTCKIQHWKPNFAIFKIASELLENTVRKSEVCCSKYNLRNFNFSSCQVWILSGVFWHLIENEVTIFFKLNFWCSLTYTYCHVQVNSELFPDYVPYCIWPKDSNPWPLALDSRQLFNSNAINFHSM